MQISKRSERLEPVYGVGSLPAAETQTRDHLAAEFSGFAEPYVDTTIMLTCRKGSTGAIPEVGPAGVTHIAHGPEASDGGRGR